MTMQEIRSAAGRAGSKWFTGGAMRFFGTRLGAVHSGPGGVYFVASHQPPSGQRLYSVHTFDREDGGVGTAGEFCDHATRAGAGSEAKRLAAG